MRLNVLIACEESQAECQAFRDAGHNAFSCDIQECRKSGHPEWHIHGDVSPFLNGCCRFRTQNGKRHQVSKWHLIIAHPPCTYLCKMSSCQLYENGEIRKERYEAMLKAREFFFRCLDAKADYVAVENPQPMAMAQLPKPDCFVQPYWFGHKYSKKTLYWLKGLPPIMPNATNPNFKCYVQSSRGKYRSRTFSGVAKALAEQWGSYILDDLKKT